MKTSDTVYMIHVHKMNPDSLIFEFSYIHPIVFATAELAQKYVKDNFSFHSKEFSFPIYTIELVKDL